MNSVKIDDIRKKVYQQIEKKKGVMQNPQNKKQDFINITYENYEFKYKENDFIIFLIDTKYCIGKIIYIYKKNNSILTALVKTIELQSKVLLNEGVMHRIGFANMVNVKETEMFINKYEEIDSNSTVFPLALFCKISTDVKQKLIGVFEIDDEYIQKINIHSVDNYKDKINISKYFENISPFNMIDKDTIENYFKNYTDFDEDFKELLGEIEISEDDNNKIKELLLDNNSNLPTPPSALQPALPSALPPVPPTGSNSVHVDEYANFEEILEIFEDKYNINVKSMEEKLNNLNKLPIELNPK
jgi:hypothetical protein